MPAAIELSGVVKDYPGVRALDCVDLEVAAGEVHALVGENGAGKSTLMKLAAGAVVAEAGSVRILGREVMPGDPRAAAEAGLAMIYQELTVIPEMTAMANVLLGRWPARWGLLKDGAARAAYAAVARELQADIPAHALAGRLSTADQQLLEIMRALASGRQVLVMDEPTASLGGRERAALSETIGHLRAQGRSVVYISHDLREVLYVADRVSVMRDGRLVETRAASAWNHDALVQAMIGRQPDLAERRRRRAVREEVVLQVRDLRSAGVRVEELHLRRGEILGVAGLVGSGRTELLRALAGADPNASGELELDGRRVRFPRSVAEALRRGIALAPEDRKADGLVLDRPGATNIALPDLGRPARHGFASPRTLRAAARQPAEAVQLDPARLRQPAGTYSGGNQQKLMLARWIYRRPRVLLLDEPTRGIDIGAKSQVFATMRRLAEEGTAIVLVSSELEEVVDNADRVVVLAGGELVADLGADATVDDVLTASFASGVVAA